MTLPKGFTLLQVVPRLEGGGVEEVTLEIAGAVAQAGGRSLVASAGGILEAALALRGATMIRLPLADKSPLTIALNGGRLARVIGEEKVSLVHVRSRAPAFSAWWGARAARVPLVTTYHGLYRADSPLKRWYNSIMTRGDLVTASSRFVADHIAGEHRLDRAKIVLAPEGVDCSLFDPSAVSAERIAAMRAAWELHGPEASRPVLLLAARMTRIKGHLIAMEALARIGRREVLLVFAGHRGRPRYERELKAAARSLGIAGQVRIVGPIGDMPAAYLAADLILAPSTAPETFGRTVAEAGAMERPVLAAAAGGPAEIVADRVTGWLVAPGDTAAWSAAIEAALASGEAERRTMGAAARQRVMAAYSLPAMCETTFAVYRRALEGRA
jgi:glycosyltransferase involved in cell wall biosynthesis